MSMEIEHIFVISNQAKVKYLSAYTHNINDNYNFKLFIIYFFSLCVKYFETVEKLFSVFKTNGSINQSKREKKQKTAGGRQLTTVGERVVH